MIVRTISEAKSTGILYHYTFTDTDIYSILNDGLRSNRGFVSFTRNYKYGEYTPKFKIQIIIDGNKLSNRYKIQPFNYANSDIKDKEISSHAGSRNKYPEYEEMIKTNGYVDILDSILEINILTSLPKEFKDSTIASCNQFNIKYNIVSKFNKYGNNSSVSYNTNERTIMFHELLVENNIHGEYRKAFYEVFIEFSYDNGFYPKNISKKELLELVKDLYFESFDEHYGVVNKAKIIDNTFTFIPYNDDSKLNLYYTLNKLYPQYKLSITNGKIEII